MNVAFHIPSVLHLGASLSGLFFLASGSDSLLGAGDLLYAVLLVAYFIFGVFLLFSHRDFASFQRNTVRRLVLATDYLVPIALVLFLFEYIFALNANMDYVRRFIETGGNLSLAINTAAERRIALVRYLPLLGASTVTFLLLRLTHHRAVDWATVPRRRFPQRGGEGGAGDSDLGSLARVWALPLVLISAVLHAFSFPSFVSNDGFGWLAWFALVPLFLALWYNRYGRGVYLLTVFGAVTMIVSNYWLGTFSLVSLQLTIVFFVLFYLAFAFIVLLPLRSVGRIGFFVLAAGWTAFEYLRSTGFLGYPWVLTGHSQYAFVPLIQIASVTGVWGVSAVVLSANASIAATLVGRTALMRRLLPLLATLGAVGAMVAGGWAAVRSPMAEPTEKVSIALVQQNSDPRKHDYERTFESLRRLTDESLEEAPDLVAWSETAFVPNIRRWSREDPNRYRLARLVLAFRQYQESIGTWLLTGNDDYRLVTNEAGEEIDRLNFNAAVLFAPAGDRVETYHKVKLVPFTEYFPYRRQLPWVYDFLQDFDVHFWEPGEELTVFHHPKFTFATPICFEDVFPNHIRRFVREDLDVILALTNDYWSLSPVQAKQHFVASLFRTVENRRPMARATASGLTGVVDDLGRIGPTLPYFEESYVVVDVDIRPNPETLYTRYGDWFPVFALAVSLTLSLLGFAAGRQRP